MLFHKIVLDINYCLQKIKPKSNFCHKANTTDVNPLTICQELFLMTLFSPATLVRNNIYIFIITISVEKLITFFATLKFRALFFTNFRIIQ